MKKTILEKVPSHARDNVIGAMITKHGGNVGDVFYDSATHSVVRLEEEVKVAEKIVEKEPAFKEKPKQKRKKK